MNKLSKEKRNQLIMVSIVTAVVLGGLWFGLLSIQLDYLKTLARRKGEVQADIEKQDRAIKNAVLIESEANQATNRLNELESAMADPRDELSWMRNTVFQFVKSYKVEINTHSPTTEEREMDLLPKFPYKQVALIISGTAYYHDFGQFVAAFENHFPYFRMQNIILEPVPSVQVSDKDRPLTAIDRDAAATEKEKLTFTVTVISLVRPASS